MIDKKLIASPALAAQAVRLIQSEKNIPFGQGRWLWTSNEYEQSKLERVAAVRHTVMQRTVHQELATRHNEEIEA